VRAALVLVGYALLVGTVGAAALRRARWPERAPRLGVTAWQTLSGTVMLALVLAGASALMPDAAIGVTLVELIHSCVRALRAHDTSIADGLVHGTGAAVTVVLATRAVALVGMEMWAASRSRREHLAGLLLAARRDPKLDALVVDHPSAVAYCLPGGTGTVVVTSAALAALDDGELSAVMAHERAHLRGRHHLVLSVARAMAQAVPVLPVFAWARTEQASLLEMIADDAAVRRSSRGTVARALVHLAEGPVPVPALGAGDVAAVSRVNRLLAPLHPVGALPRLTIAAGLLALAVIPPALTAAPVLVACGFSAR
jgi:Zn-dependent protease with chaperone function